MVKRPFIPGERHHWWPKSLSNYWTDETGLIGRIDTKGKVTRSTPSKTAKISDGHNIRLDSAWDTTFEEYFDRADSGFPRVVEFLKASADQHRHAPFRGSDFQAHPCGDSDLLMLSECLVSLAIRSPRFRQDVVTSVQSLRSATKEELEPLIAMNMRQTFALIIRNISARGKYLVIFSKGPEFIFGDGFYHNVRCGSQGMSNSRLLVPLTPHIVALHVTPLRCKVEPRLVTLEASEDVVALMNETIQIYSREWLFFRREQPVLSAHFLRSEHLEYSDPDPIEQLMQQIPGVGARRLPWSAQL